MSITRSSAIQRMQTKQNCAKSCKKQATFTFRHFGKCPMLAMCQSARAYWGILDG